MRFSEDLLRKSIPLLSKTSDWYLNPQFYALNMPQNVAYQIQEAKIKKDKKVVVE